MCRKLFFLIIALHVPVMLGLSQPIHESVFTKSGIDSGKWFITPVQGYDPPEGSGGVFTFQDGWRDGYALTLKPGEGTLVFDTRTWQALDTSYVVVTLEYTVVTGTADVAVVALNSEDGETDGQMGYTLTRESAGDAQAARRLHTIFAPISEELSSAAQVTVPKDAAEPAEVILHSISLYGLNETGRGKVPTVPSGDFSEPSDDLLINVNADTGSVNYLTGEETLSLAVSGNGEAANAGVTSEDGYSAAEDTLLVATADAAKVSGDDGVTALVMLSGPGSETYWQSGVFLFNSTISTHPKYFKLVTGGALAVGGQPVLTVAQNGGGQGASEIRVDNVTLQTLPLEGIKGLQPVGEGNAAESLAASLVLPQTLFSGSEGSFSLTAQTAKGHSPVSLPYTVMLTKGDQSVTLYENSTDANGFSSSRFTVPELDGGTWDIQLKSNNQQILAGQVAVENGGVIFIETDKPIYKPGQLIQGRVILLNNALKPLSGTVNVSINDAKGLKIFKEDLTANEYGVASFELPLAQELNFGTWKITAKGEGENQVERDVTVDRYTLPSYEVVLDFQKDWFLVDEKITGSVSSNFFFGKPVQGSVKIEALKYVAEWETYATVEGRLQDGAFEFELPAAGYIAGTQGAEGAGTVQLCAVVTDDTGHEEKTDQLLRIVQAGINVKLIPESPVIKPGLNQELLIVTESPGGAPLSSDVKLDVVYFTEDGSELGNLSETVNTHNGLAVYRLDIPERTSFVSITATASLDGKRESENLVLNAVYSPGAHYIHLRQASEGVLQAGEQAVFNVYSTTGGNMYYDVYANGRTVFSNVTNSDSIQFTVTPEMAPSAKLVVYSIQENNEVAADVLPFSVEFTGGTELQAAFSAEEVKPGDAVKLSLQSAGQSMIGLAVVDESVFALAKGRLNLQNVFTELERIFQEPQIEVHEDPNQIDGRFFGPVPELGGKGAYDILLENNLQIVTTESLHVPKAEDLDPWQVWEKWNRRNVNGPPFPFPNVFFDDVLEAAPGGGTGDAETFQEPDRVRTFFPETWIWQPELLTDASGVAELDLTAPDSITNWKLHAFSTSQSGIGITESALRVFQDFFVEPDLPYAVTRGDRFPLRVRIFNYVDTEQVIQITLEDADGLGLQDEAVQTVTVPGQGLSSVTFTLQPNKVGLLPVSLIAQSASRADAIRKDLRVEPEGVRREMVHNGVLRDSTEVEIVFLPPPIIDPVLEDRTPIIEEIVPDSERFKVSITASLIGQAMNGLDDLLGMPYGCGEQNMIFLAPDVEILRYLDASGQAAPEIRAKAEFFITTGYQRELTFQRQDGSFSAFGDSDESGSLWLTAFVLNVFSSAREIRTIDDTVLSNAANWILSHQNDDGSWDPVGFVIHDELTGGLNGNLTLTAYVTLSLIEYGQADQTAVDKALAYLAATMTDEKTDAYALAQIAYALTKAGHPSADEALDLLLAKAVVDGDGMHWEPHPIETTGYAILSLLAQERIEAQPAINWLTTQRNGLGGYGSTQDTVVALKALTAAASQQTRELDAQIDVLVDGELAHTFTANADNFDVLQTLEIDKAETITLRQTGQGRVLYQAVRAFNINVPETKPVSDIQLDVTYSSEHVAVDDIVDVNVSVTYNGGRKTGMAMVDVSVPTGFALVQESLDRVREHELIKRIEQAGRKVIFYIDHLEPETKVEFAFQVKAQYPVRADGGVSAAYLYYDTDTRAEASAGEFIVE